MTDLDKFKAKRKTFVAREDLLDNLAKIAKQKGYSLYALVNEIFELFLKAEEIGVDLRRIFDERWILENAKRSGFILGVESLWYSLADLAYEEAKNQVLKDWFDVGVWFAKRYTTRNFKNPFEALRRDLEAFLWNASQFSMYEANERIYIRVLSPRFSEGYTFLLAAFLEGILSGLGFEVVEREVFKGNIRVEGLKSGKGGN
ncbi:MAG: hypothetical protein QW707_10030 [Candidatus Bathyarchaeia archaeon]